MHQIVCVQAEKPTGYYRALFFLIWHLSCQKNFFFYKVALIFFYKFAEKWSMLKVGFYRQNDFNRDPCPRLNSSSKLWTSVLFPSIKEWEASTMSSAKFLLKGRLWGQTFPAFLRDVCVDFRRSFLALENITILLYKHWTKNLLTVFRSVRISFRNCMSSRKSTWTAV